MRGGRRSGLKSGARVVRSLAPKSSLGGAVPDTDSRPTASEAGVMVVCELGCRREHFSFQVVHPSSCLRLAPFPQRMPRIPFQKAAGDREMCSGFVPEHVGL